MKKTTARRTEYHIYNFMYELGLKKSVLSVYATLYSFTIGDRGLYHGAQSYLAESLEISVRTVQNALKELYARTLIEKYVTEDGKYSGVRCRLDAITESQEKALGAAVCAPKEKAEPKPEPITENKTECTSTPAEDIQNEETLAHLKHVDDLCARIRAKISGGGKESIAPAPKCENTEKPELKMSEHEKNTFLMMEKYERHGDNRKFLSFGKSGGVIMTEEQYKRLLAILPTEELMPYFVKLENMLNENIKNGRKPPHSHYKTVRKWIEEDMEV